MEELKKPKPSKEMVVFWSELQDKSNFNYRQKGKTEKLLKSKKELEDKISEAAIGYGLALKVLDKKKEKIIKEIEQIRDEIKEDINFNTETEFKKRFGVSTYQLDFNWKLTDKDVEEATKLSKKEDDEED